MRAACAHREAVTRHLDGNGLNDRLEHLRWDARGAAIAAGKRRKFAASSSS
jgi:hypothetical protein